MTQLSVSEARAILPEVLDRVAAGEEITITRHGHPVAVLLRPDAVRTRRAEQAIEQARKIGALVASAREQPLVVVDMPDQRVEELIEAVRAGRRS
jgi:prevent-host-death family protein